MAIQKTFAGLTFSIPQDREPKTSEWGIECSNYMQAIADYSLTRTGGSQALTAELNLGSSFGVLVAYFKSSSANISSSGMIRLARADQISWRNAANDADLALGVNASNQLVFNGDVIGGETYDSSNVTYTKDSWTDIDNVHEALDDLKDNKSDTSHNHDASYAASGHDHSGVYSPAGHDHSGVYATAAHNHDSSYAATGHNHDSDYAAATHAHSTISVSDGSTSSPSINFANDTDTGLSLPSAGVLSFSTGGTERLYLTNTAIGSGSGVQYQLISGSTSAPAIGFQGDTDTGMWRSEANTLNFSTGGTERLELSSSGIKIGTTYTLPLTDGTNGQVLSTNGSGAVAWSDQSGGSGISDIVEDTSPQLGGSLDVNGNSIVSASNGNIAITPNGTGSVVLDGLNWPQADGSANQVLSTNGSGQLSWATPSSGSSSSMCDDLNYITNPSGATDTTGWSSVGDLDIARTTTAGDLIRERTTPTGLKITADANTQSTADYVYFDFTLDDIDVSKDIQISWNQKRTGTYVAGDLAVIIAAQSDRTTALHTPNTTAIPAIDGEFKTAFRASTTQTLSLVIRSTTDMAENGGLVLSNILVKAFPKNKTTTTVNNSVLSVTSNVSGNAWTSTNASGIAYCDSNDKWRFKFNIYGTFATALQQPSLSMTDIEAEFGQGVTFRAWGPGGAYWTGTTLVAGSWESTPDWYFSGDIELDHEPSWARTYLDF